MNVLLATYAFLPNTTGIYVYLRSLAQGLADLGHQVDVLSLDPGRHRYYLSDGSAAVTRAVLYGPVYKKVSSVCRRRVPSAGAWVWRREAERYCFELAASLFRLGRYDVLHAQDAVAARALSRVRLPGVPLLTTFHAHRASVGFKAARVRKPFIYRYLALEERLGAEGSDLALFPSRWLQSVFTDGYGLARSQTRVVPYGLHLADFLQAAAQRPLPLPRKPGKKVILCPARLAPEKGHQHLIAALAMLADRRQDFVCWLAGDGRARSGLERQVLRQGLGGTVFFLGSRRDVPALMAAADVVALPSVLDNMPYAVMEAQVSSRAVVASRVGGVPEMIKDGETGLLVTPGDARDLAFRLGQVLDSENLRLDLGSRAGAWGRQQWSGTRMVLDTLAAYEEVRRGKSR